MSSEPVYVSDTRRTSLALCVTGSALLLLFIIVVSYYRVSVFPSAGDPNTELWAVAIFPAFFAVGGALGYLRARRIEFYEDRIRTSKGWAEPEDVAHSNLVLGPLTRVRNGTAFTIATGPGHPTPSGLTFRAVVVNRRLPIMDGIPVYNWIYSKISPTASSPAVMLDYVRTGPRKKSMLYAGIACLVLLPIIAIGGPAFFWSAPATSAFDVEVGLALMLAGIVLAGAGAILLSYRPKLSQ